MAGATSLEHLIAFASSSYRDAMDAGVKRAKWNSISIRKESREAELNQLQDLYERLKAVHARSAFSDPEMPHRLAVMMAAEVFRATGAPAMNDALITHIGNSALDLLSDEIVFGFPEINFAIPLALDDSAALRAYLEDKRQFLLHADTILKKWGQRFVAMWAALFAALPDQVFRGHDSGGQGLLLKRPLVQAMPDAATAVQGLLGAIVTAEDETPIFASLARTVANNIWTATGVAEDQRATTSRTPLLPRDCREPADRIPQLYLAGTPFLPLFAETLSLDITQAHRFEHCHIVAGTGHGKTQLMQAMMLADFDDANRPGVVAIDSQGDMLKTLAKLERFNPAHDDRLIILDPADTEWPLRLNLFDVNRDRLEALPRGEREQLLAGIVELYDYIFGALLGAELTQKQSVVFRFLAQLMLAIPNATIHTLRQLLEDPTPYWSYIEEMPVTAKTFLTEHLFAVTKRGQKPNDYNATRAQVLRRLYGILSNPTFERLFSHPKNALDMKQALDEGKIILVNTAKDVLKAEASAIFGRYVIALILKAALERASDAKQNRKAAFVYIDEAADYFDGNIDTFLIQARKYNVGLTIAHQFLDQLSPALRASVLTNPAIRFAGGLSAKDASALKDDMRTSSEFLLNAKKRETTTEFACFVRNLTPAALTHSLKLGQAEREPGMTEEAYQKLLTRVRSAVAAPISETLIHVAGVPPAPEVKAAVEDAGDFADSY